MRISSKILGLEEPSLAGIGVIGRKTAVADVSQEPDVLELIRLFDEPDRLLDRQTRHVAFGRPPQAFPRPFHLKSYPGIKSED